MKLCLQAIIIIFLFSCNSPELVIERPKEVWVTRSVLDKRPRMLNIALHKNLYVAYSTQFCSIYKAWQGSINYDGAVYNEVHGFQPSSQGFTFLEEPEQIPWKIAINNDTITPTVIYRGHHFKNDQVSLNYDLQYQKDTIYIQETPEYYAVGADTTKIGFKRMYLLSRVPDNAEVFISGEKTGLLKLKTGRTILKQEFVSTISTGEKQKYESISVTALMEKNDCATCHNKDVHTIGPAYIDISRRYSADPAEYLDRLAMKIINGGSGNWGSVPMTAHPHLSFEDARLLVNYIIEMDSGSRQKDKTIFNKPIAFANTQIKNNYSPGDGEPLVSVHPSFTLSQARPGGFHPRVGGMDFLSDGRLVICTWDSTGSVFILNGIQTGDTNSISVKKIATGLAEPLGLKVVENEIYILQKQELTRLIDNNNDEIIDEYQTVCNGWKVSDNFHEFAFGLVYKDGYFYGTLATAINYGGASSQPQISDRGKVIKISRKDGSFSFVAKGLRTPNGIGIGTDKEIFIADNQGDWLPANKIVHLQADAWYGSRSVDFEGTKNINPTLPVVWLPQNDIANSPSQMTILNKGPYQNQMIYGDVTHGGIKRVFAEKINGKYQGAAFRFTQGLEAGVNRLVWGPDGALYVGGIGSSGNWGHPGKLTYGLQRLEYNNSSTFEMQAIRAKSDGIEIEFTEPLAKNSGENISDYQVKQWWYLPTENYGGPKMDEELLTISKIQISADRRKVFLQLLKMKKEHVVYVRLNIKTIRSDSNKNLWSTEAWYTMNNIPK